MHVRYDGCSLFKKPHLAFTPIAIAIAISGERKDVFFLSLLFLYHQLVEIVTLLSAGVILLFCLFFLLYLVILPQINSH